MEQKHQDIHYRYALSSHVNAQSIEATELGVKTVETLENIVQKYLMSINAAFEEETELVREDKNKGKILKKRRNFDKSVNVLSSMKEYRLGIIKSDANNAHGTGPSDNVLCKEVIFNSLFSRFKVISRAFKNPVQKHSSLPSGLPKPSKYLQRMRLSRSHYYPSGQTPIYYCINKQCKLKVEWIKQQQKRTRQQKKK